MRKVQHQLTKRPDQGIGPTSQWTKQRPHTPEAGFVSGSLVALWELVSFDWQSSLVIAQNEREKCAESRFHPHRTRDATCNATQVNGACCCEWECPYCAQATSKDLRSNLRAHVLCGLGLKSWDWGLRDTCAAYRFKILKDFLWVCGWGKFDTRDERFCHKALIFGKKSCLGGGDVGAHWDSMFSAIPAPAEENCADVSTARRQKCAHDMNSCEEHYLPLGIGTNQNCHSLKFSW